MRFINTTLYLIIIPFLCTSCSQSIVVHTNTFADRDKIPNGIPKGSSFAVLPLRQNNSLIYKETTEKICNAIKEKKYSIEDPVNATYYLLYDFDITSSNHTMHVPFYLPGTIATSTGTIYGNQGLMANYHGQSQSSGSTILIPKEITLFTKSFSAWIYNANIYRNEQKEELIWNGTSVASSTDPDLRKMFAYLLTSNFEFFGNDTKEIISKEIKIN